MTAALCLNCGEIKIGALTSCPKCRAPAPHDDQVAIAFSDHLIGEAALRELGSVIATLQRATPDPDLRHWTFMHYVSTTHPSILTVELAPEMKVRCEHLLERVTLPWVTLLPGRRNDPTSQTTAAARERRFLTAEWRYLAMLNYEIAPSVLAPHVPAGCELDAWGGRAFVSVVGFQFLSTRVLGVPIPFHRNFEEVNLRFYVRHKAEGTWRRGVVFIKEIVPRPAIAWVARTVYGENYVALPMRHALDGPDGSGAMTVAYEWRRSGTWEGLSVGVKGEPVLAAEDSEEAFITEHYWGYTRQRDGATVAYQVEHPRWRVWRAVSASLRCDAASLYGPEFAQALAGPASTAFVADGSAIVVRRGRRLL